jgi:hypothetical protein
MKAQEFIVENADQAAVTALQKKHGWSTGTTGYGDLYFTWQGNTYVFYGERMRINFPNGESASIVWGRKPDWQGRNSEFSFAQAVQRKLLKFDLSIWQQLDRGQINDNQALQKFKAENDRQAREAIAQGVAEGLNELTNTSLKVKQPKDFVNTNDRKQVTWKVMKFKSGKDTYLINFTMQHPPAFGKKSKSNWNAVNVAFGVKEPQDEYSFGDEINTDLTARNKNQFLIYSTVINAVRKFITEYNTEIDEIIMQGAGERQQAMYQRFFQSAGKYFPGWHYNGKHSLVRDVPRQPVKKVREQGVTEGKDFDRCFDQACKLYDRAVSKNLEPKLVQVADFQGDGNGADPRWMKLPQHVWQHYVVIVGDQVLDPTAKQFGDSMPTQYKVSDLDRLWGKQYQIRPRQGVAEGEVVPLGKKHRGDLDSVNSCSKCGGKLEGGTYMGQRIKVCLPCKQVYLPPNSGIDQQGNKIKEQGVAENFDDGKKPGRKGLAKRVGVDCKQPISKLRSIASNSSGERQRMAHWCANMKSGRKK